MFLYDLMIYICTSDVGGRVGLVRHGWHVCGGCLSCEVSVTDNRNRIDVHLYYRRWYPRVCTRKHHEIYPTGTANF